MKDFKLTPEKELLDVYEHGEFKSVPNLEEEKEYFRQVARNTLNKRKNINIHLSIKDFTNLKRKAIEEGIPY